MGDTSETKTKVLYRELFLGVVALKTPIPQNHYLRDKVPFLKSGHIMSKYTFDQIILQLQATSYVSDFALRPPYSPPKVFSSGS